MPHAAAGSCEAFRVDDLAVAVLFERAQVIVSTIFLPRDHLEKGFSFPGVPYGNKIVSSFLLCYRGCWFSGFQNNMNMVVAEVLHLLGRYYFDFEDFRPTILAGVF